MIKLFLGVLIVLVALVFVYQLSSVDNKIVDNEENNYTDSKVYSGPVRPSDNEEYFRQTGITKQKDIE